MTLAGRGLAMAAQQSRGTLLRAPVSMFHTTEKSSYKNTDKREVEWKNKVPSGRRQGLAVLSSPSRTTTNICMKVLRICKPIG